MNDKETKEKQERPYIPMCLCGAVAKEYCELWTDKVWSGCLKLIKYKEKDD